MRFWQYHIFRPSLFHCERRQMRGGCRERMGNKKATFTGPLLETSSWGFTEFNCHNSLMRYFYFTAKNTEVQEVK